MRIDTASKTPIYLQISNALEDKILEEEYLEDMQIPSTTELSMQLKINPHTVLKGMNLLVDQKILYKKRGIGMFVSPGSLTIIKEKRRRYLLKTKMKDLLNEARLLEVSKKELIEIIEGSVDYDWNQKLKKVYGG